MNPFFRRRVNIEKVRDFLKINAEQVYYETESYSQFKYELTLRVVEAIMWNEYELGWENLPEEEEIEFVTEVSNILEKDIKALFNKYKKNMNLQESIKRILMEESKPILMIRRRVPDDELEREFSESLDMSSNMLRNTNKDDGSIMSLNRFIDVTISILMDGIHYKLYSTMPEDSQWYDEVIESLKDYYKDRIKSRYKKLVSNT